MKKLSMRIVVVCFALIIACSYAMADEKLDMVKIPGKNFSMLRTEVTQALYEAVMGANPSEFKGKNNPVEGLSWYDAIYFCNRLSEKEGLRVVYALDGETDFRKWNYRPHNQDEIYGNITQDISADGYRLPTVEEWQYAAKGGEDYIYSGCKYIDNVAWYSDISGGKSHPVAQKKPNGYGLYDMSGNVWELCWDSYGDSSCYFCGGSWFSFANDCEVGSLSWTYFDCWLKGSLGFRVVRTIK